MNHANINVSAENSIPSFDIVTGIIRGAGRHETRDKFQARLSQAHKAAITLSRSPAGPATAEKGRGHAGEQHDVII